MPKDPVKLPRRAVRATQRNAVAVAAPRELGSGFSSFRYSYTEITTRDGKAHVRARNTSFEGGRLTSESFEGDLEGDAHDHVVRQTQQYLSDQTTQFLRALSWFLPGSNKRSSGGD